MLLLRDEDIKAFEKIEIKIKKLIQYHDSDCNTYPDDTWYYLSKWKHGVNEFNKSISIKVENKS